MTKGGLKKILLWVFTRLFIFIGSNCLCMTGKKLFIKTRQSPGDILMLTAAVRDLKKAHPEFQINVSTPAMELWNNNPYLDKSINKFNADQVIEAQYPLVHRSNYTPYHFIHGYRQHLENVLKITIPQGPFQVDLHFTEQEKSVDPYTLLSETKHHKKPIWIIDAGFKSDFTCKMWELNRYQEVVNQTKDKITWIQMGAKEHNHTPLNHAVNLLGKTTHRQLVHYMLHTDGVLTPVSYPMHLATIPYEKHPEYTRPCIVIAGAREPNTWEQYRNHQYIHTLGILPCSSNKPCWKSRVTKLNDNNKQDNSICLMPITTPSGQTIPKCLDLITVQQVVQLIELYIK